MSASVQPPLIRTGSMSSAQEMRALHRERQALQFPKPVAKPHEKPTWTEPDPEFAFTDESRDFSHWCEQKCPQCDNWETVLCKRVEVAGEAAVYFVRCEKCGNQTAPQRSGQIAIRVWKMVAALSK